MRSRLEGIALAGGADFETLDVHVTTVPKLRLDLREHTEHLFATVEEVRPRLLVLDPFVRLHRIVENAAAEARPCSRVCERSSGAFVWLSSWSITRARAPPPERTFGPDEVDVVISAVDSALQRLAQTPDIGHRREDVTSDDSVRFWWVGPTLTACRQRFGSIEVLLLERGERDWEGLLDGEPGLR